VLAYAAVEKLNYEFAKKWGKLYEFERDGFADQQTAAEDAAAEVAAAE
jgi:hypothetical protein